MKHFGKAHRSAQGCTKARSDGSKVQGGKGYTYTDSPVRLGESFAKPSGLVQRNNARPLVITKH